MVCVGVIGGVDGCGDVHAAASSNAAMLVLVSPNTIIRLMN
jgi:hypothetical protein